MRPEPVTTPSPGKICWSSPKSVERWVTKRSSSTKLPSSSRRSSRSRAVSFPFLCCWATRSGPPPCSARPCRWCSSSRSLRGSGMEAEDIENGEGGHLCRPRRLFRYRRLFKRRLHRRDDRLIRESNDRQHDPMMNRIHFERLEVERLAFF